jgi:hypothetical protein
VDEDALVLAGIFIDGDMLYTWNPVSLGLRICLMPGAESQAQRDQTATERLCLLEFQPQACHPEMIWRRFLRGASLTKRVVFGCPPQTCTWCADQPNCGRVMGALARFEARGGPPSGMRFITGGTAQEVQAACQEAAEEMVEELGRRASRA